MRLGSQFEEKKANNSVKISQLALPSLSCQWPLCEGTQLARLSVRLCGSWVISVYSRDMLRRITSQPDFGNTPIFPHSLSQTATVHHSFVKFLAGKTDTFIQGAGGCEQLHMWMIHESLN